MSSLKRYNTQTSQWEYVAIGKQGITGQVGPTGPTGPTPTGKANLDGGNTFTGNQTSNGSWSSSAINGSPRFSATNPSANNDQFLYLLNGINNTGTKAVHFINSSTRSADGGANNYTIRNDGGSLILGNSSFQTFINGPTTMPNQPVATGRFSCTAGSGLANLWQPSRQVGITLSGSRITVPTTGLYLIGLNHITNNGTGRVDSNIYINGGLISSSLSSDNGSGFRYRSMQVVRYMNAGDYIEFNSGSWYNAPNYDEWKTFFVTMTS
jgi:hypothetical protein